MVKMLYEIHMATYVRSYVCTYIRTYVLYTSAEQYFIIIGNIVIISLDNMYIIS